MTTMTTNMSPMTNLTTGTTTLIPVVDSTKARASIRTNLTMEWNYAGELLASMRAGRAVSAVEWTDGHTDYVCGTASEVTEYIADYLLCTGICGQFSVRPATVNDAFPH